MAAWDDAALMAIDKSDIPDMPHIYGFIHEPQHIATAFLNVSTRPEERENLFRFWATTISAIATRRAEAFATARAKGTDARVNLSGIAKDVKLLMKTWPTGTYSEQFEELIIYITESNNQMDTQQVGANLSGNRKRRKQDAQIPITAPSTAPTPLPPA